MLLTHLVASTVVAQSGASGSTLALISGGSAVFGALVGGTVAGWFNLRGQQKRQEFERAERLESEKRDDTLRRHQLRGVAREVRSLLRHNEAVFERHQELGFWWTPDLPGPEFFEREQDRVLLASYLTAEQWTAVENAERETLECITLRDLSVSIAARWDRPEGMSALKFDFDKPADGEPQQGWVDPRTRLAAAIQVMNGAVRALGPVCDGSPLSGPSAGG
jgi:hypothetical protein